VEILILDSQNHEAGVKITGKQKGQDLYVMLALLIMCIDQIFRLL